MGVCYDENKASIDSLQSVVENANIQQPNTSLRQAPVAQPGGGASSYLNNQSYMQINSYYSDFLKNFV